ncbi:MAG: hypothetical protein IJZ95_07190 [Oscillospiraceae bacterium]|nr:hypothetical protein [Oscillospiraceae bacterium]
MSDFWDKFGKAAGHIAKGVGNAMLDSLESDAHKYSRDNRYSQEQRDQFAEFESSLKDLRGKDSNKR